MDKFKSSHVTISIYNYTDRRIKLLLSTDSRDLKLRRLNSRIDRSNPFFWLLVLERGPLPII